MIRNNEEKRFAENQICKLENILLSLKKQLLPGREKQFNAMAAVYVRMIRELREEIDEYTGMENLNIKKSDINIHIEGPLIGYGSVPISVISNYLESFKKTLQNFYITMSGVNFKRIPKYISDLTDLSLNEFQPGSINLAIGLPFQQFSLLEDITIEKVLDTYFNILKWLYYNDDSYIKEIDDELKEKLLIHTLKTLPDDKKISSITFFGNMIQSNQHITVNYGAKKKIKNLIEQMDNKDNTVFLQGCIREIDLDKLTFVLRDLEQDADVNEIKCKLNKAIASDIKEYLDSRVLIKGKKDKKNIVTVKFIEKL